MSEPIIKFEHFGFKYNAQQSPTLYDINLELRPDEKVLIVGPSGCGKSTLVHCINGLIPFSYKGEMTGSLTLDGVETSKMSLFEISKKVGTVLQDSDAQFVGLTVAEDIAFAMENDCIDSALLKSRVKTTARMVEMQDFLKHAPGELSGGQKQRVSMAGILVDDVEMILYDEPLANLDPATGKTAIELIDKMQKKTRSCVVIIEHRLEDVLHRDVDRIILMEKGRIVADTTPDEFLSGPFLQESGIREPLYVTALKYAGVEITPSMQPHSIRTLSISEEDKDKVVSWFKTKEKPILKKEEKPIFTAKNVSFSYAGKYKALEDINLSFNDGEMLAIVGTNGAGKSTFAKVVCGFETDNEGELFFEGTDMKKLSIKERADNIGYVMQNPNQMISKVMITDEVAFGLKNRNLAQEEIDKRVEEALRICDLWKFRNWPVSALSYGQKKRVTIASILVLEPKVIILDEPTAGQDYRHYTKMMEFLLKLNESGITIVMVTHDMHLMLEYAQRTLVFSKGRVIADDIGANILTDPQIVLQASLKETSLYNLALMCGIESPKDFVRCFIDYERENLRKEALNKEPTD